MKIFSHVNNPGNLLNLSERAIQIEIKGVRGSPFGLQLPHSPLIFLPNSISAFSLFNLSMETVNVPELVERLGSDEDAVRKMAVFKLQTNIGDPSFADLFIADGGLTRLRYLTLHASGNTLAYSLTSFSRLLDVDKGWECVDEELVERVSIPLRNFYTKN